MEILKDGFALVLHGVKDCVVGVVSLKDFLCAQELQLTRGNVERISVRHSNCNVTVRSKLLQCAVFGIIFWVSNFLFNHFFLQYALLRLAEWTGEDVESNGVASLKLFFYASFFFLWIAPLLILSKLLNFSWYQDIADLVLLKSGVRKTEHIKLSDMWADQIKSLVLQMFYCLQGFCIYFLPVPFQMQNLWYLFHFSLVASLYAFEYKWVHKGWSLHRRILHIDHKWPYYLGFGLPLAFISAYVSSFIDSVIIFATLFPMYVVSSSVTDDNQSPVFSYPFHTFRVADAVSDIVIGFVMKLVNLALGSV